jgi:hypothetical protein
MRLLALAFSIALAACGKTDSNPQAVQATSPAPQKIGFKKAPEGQPRFVMVKVPVDAQGNEDLSAAESKVVADAQMTDANAAAQAFASGESITLADELDQSSSSESWGRRHWYWNGWNNGYYNGYVNGAWATRNPYLYFNNYSYGYNYGNFYNYRNCNYYYWYNY